MKQCRHTSQSALLYLYCDDRFGVVMAQHTEITVFWDVISCTNFGR